MSTQSVADLIGETLTSHDPYGEDMQGAELYAGFIPDRSVVHIPQMQLGDGLAGPPNDQQLQIQRDNRPIAVDELGMQGPFMWTKVAHIRAGRMFPLNYEWDDALDQVYPGRVVMEDVLHPSPLSPGQQAAAHDGVPPVEVMRHAHTVFFTATPAVGWEGY